MRDCTLWEYGAAVAGWRAVHAASDDQDKLGEADVDSLWAGVMERTG